MFEEEETEGMILVDASDAFNRAVDMLNVQIICPSVATFLINLYRKPAKLIINSSDGNIQITSEEGTTQGCNLGMIFYAL